MSRRRKHTLPGAGLWDSFFDKSVQAVLLERFDFSPPQPAPSELQPTPFSEWPQTAQFEFNAWPIIAYLCAEGLATATTSSARKMAEEVVACYATDRVFFAEVLAAVSRYHALPEPDRSLTRRISDLSLHVDPESPPIDPNANEPEPLLLMDWKTIRAIVGAKNSLKQFMVEFNREKKRRAKIASKWGEHFDAYWFLVDNRKPLLPFREVSF